LLSYVELTPFLLTVLTDCDASSLVMVFPPEVVPVFVKVTAGVVFEVGVERRTLVDGTMVDEGDGDADVPVVVVVVEGDGIVVTSKPVE